MKQLKDVESKNDWFTEVIMKKYAKQWVPELADCEEYEVMRLDKACDECTAPAASAFVYRIEGEKEWKNISEGPDLCSSCFQKKNAKEISETWNLQIKDQNQARNSRLTKEYWIIPDDLQEAGFRNYKDTNAVTTNAKREAMQYTKDFMAASEENRTNLLMMGNPGTGKSHLCVAIGRTLIEKGFTVGFLTTGTLLTKIKATYNKGASRTEDEIMKDISQFNLLILDDLGSESGNKSEFDWAKKTLFEIVNKRIGRATIYTSNFNDTELGEAVGLRTASRLYTNTKFIDVFTDDYRKTLRIK